MVNKELTPKYLKDSFDSFEGLWRKFLINYMPITNFEEHVYKELNSMFD